MALDRRNTLLFQARVCCLCSSPGGGGCVSMLANGLWLSGWSESTAWASGKSCTTRPPPAPLSQVAAGLLSALRPSSELHPGAPDWLTHRRTLSLICFRSWERTHERAHACAHTYWGIMGNGIQTEEAHWLKKHSASVLFEMVYPPPPPHTHKQTETHTHTHTNKQRHTHTHTHGSTQIQTNGTGRFWVWGQQFFLGCCQIRSSSETHWKSQGTCTRPRAPTYTQTHTHIGLCLIRATEQTVGDGI